MPRESVLDRLDRHEARRTKGVPALSVLVGSRQEAIDSWAHWCRRGRRVARTFDSVSHWVRQREQPGTGLLRREGPPPIREPAAEPGPAPLSGSLVVLGSQEGLRAADLIAQGKAPETGERAALCRVLEQAPIATVALHLDRSGFEEVARSGDWGRAHTLIREGLVELPSMRSEIGRGSPVVSRVGTGEASEVVIGSGLAESRGLNRLVAESPEWRQRTRELALLCVEHRPENEARARSHAEQLLFAALEIDEVTSGRFELNARMGFRFGSSAAEIDLLGRDSGVAIEVDGYHHFRDAERYRRDRRKDLLFQSRGYLVMRFLAEDVATRLTDVVDRIRRVVGERTPSGAPHEPSRRREE